jgi:hypothetical protein
MSRQLLCIPLSNAQLARPLVSRFLSLFSRSFPATANTAFSSAIEAALAAEDWEKLQRGLSKAARAALGDGRGASAPQLREEWSDLASAIAAFERHRSAVQVRLSAYQFRRIYSCIFDLAFIVIIYSLLESPKITLMLLAVTVVAAHLHSPLSKGPSSLP